MAGSSDHGAPRIDVVVALIRDSNGRVLVSRRRPGSHMAGFWEFPGGKRGSGEAARDALGRELDEELGIRVLSAEPFMSLDHEYPDRDVALDVWTVSAFDGEPRPLEGQQLDWVAPRGLREIGLLPADLAIVDRLVAQAD
jgi:8-oxo-dGTP diphosphatase